MKGCFDDMCFLNGSIAEGFGHIQKLTPFLFGHAMNSLSQGEMSVMEEAHDWLVGLANGLFVTSSILAQSGCHVTISQHLEKRMFQI